MLRSNRAFKRPQIASRSPGYLPPGEYTITADGTAIKLEGFKVCPKCLRSKDMKEFGFRRMFRNGPIVPQSWCKGCRNQ